jgi:hypothetical protein
MHRRYGEIACGPCLEAHRTAMTVALARRKLRDGKRLTARERECVEAAT